MPVKQKGGRVSNVKKYRAIVEYEVPVTEDYKPTLRDERIAVSADTLEKGDAFNFFGTRITKVRVEVAK